MSLQYWQDIVFEQDGMSPFGYGVLAAFVSAVVTLFLYKVSRYFTPLLFPNYKILSDYDKRDWDTRYSAILHALLIVVYGFYVLCLTDIFIPEAYAGPVIFRTSLHSSTVLGISLGYFIVDFVCTLKYQMGGVEMLMHHIGSLLAVTTCFVLGQGHLFAIWMLLTELSTPFICLRWWLDKAGLKASSAYAWNGACILISWFFGRILIFPPFFLAIYRYRDEIWMLHPFCRALIVAMPIFLFYLNVFWFIKIVKGALKLFYPSLLATKTTKKE